MGGAAWDASRTHGASHTRIAPPLTSRPGGACSTYELLPRATTSRRSLTPLFPLLPLQVRLLMLNLASRLIGYHRLLVPNFYPFLQR